MHEHHSVEHIVEHALEEAEKRKAKKVLKIILGIGELLNYDDEAVRMYFAQFAAGTVLEGAEVEIRPIRAKFYCRKCESLFEHGKGVFNCPECGSFGSITDTGNELFIEGMETE
ncbi:MAG: hydrogenase maturation nickel metallochaperone HypA [Candidatus Wallbacteria bacterium]|nr:hydrogenase maturation nickel metallochaperone HypA [Candidatus Wallbacteria bacterium]